MKEIDLYTEQVLNENISANGSVIQLVAVYFNNVVEYEKLIVNNSTVWSNELLIDTKSHVYIVNDIQDGRLILTPQYELDTGDEILRTSTLGNIFDDVAIGDIVIGGHHGTMKPTLIKKHDIRKYRQLREFFIKNE